VAHCSMVISIRDLLNSYSIWNISGSLTLLNSFHSTLKWFSTKGKNTCVISWTFSKGNQHHPILLGSHMSFAPCWTIILLSAYVSSSSLMLMHGTKNQQCSSFVLDLGVFKLFITLNSYDWLRVHSIPDSISRVHQSSSNVCDPLFSFQEPHYEHKWIESKRHKCKILKCNILVGL
jgi:hypothetical protein